MNEVNKGLKYTESELEEIKNFGPFLFSQCPYVIGDRELFFFEKDCLVLALNNVDIDEDYVHIIGNDLEYFYRYGSIDVDEEEAYAFLPKLLTSYINVMRSEFRRRFSVQVFPIRGSGKCQVDREYRVYTDDGGRIVGTVVDKVMLDNRHFLIVPAVPYIDLGLSKCSGESRGNEAVIDRRFFSIRDIDVHCDRNIGKIILDELRDNNYCKGRKMFLVEIMILESLIEQIFPFSLVSERFRMVRNLEYEIRNSQMNLESELYGIYKNFKFILKEVLDHRFELNFEEAKFGYSECVKTFGGDPSVGDCFFFKDLNYFGVKLRDKSLFFSQVLHMNGEKVMAKDSYGMGSLGRMESYKRIYYDLKSISDDWFSICEFLDYSEVVRNRLINHGFYNYAVSKYNSRSNFKMPRVGGRYHWKNSGLHINEFRCVKHAEYDCILCNFDSFYDFEMEFREMVIFKIERSGIPIKDINEDDLGTFVQKMWSYVDDRELREFLEMYCGLIKGIRHFNVSRDSLRVILCSWLVGWKNILFRDRIKMEEIKKFVRYDIRQGSILISYCDGDLG